MKNKISRNRLLAYIVGLLVLTLGISASVKSDLGCSPVSSIPYTMTVLTGLEMGRATILWQSILVLLQLVLLRREFKAWMLVQLLGGFTFGYFTTFSNWIFSFLPDAQNLLARAGLSLLGIVLMGFGVWMYSTASLINLPSEGMVLVIAKKLKIAFPKAKICFDVFSVGSSAIACLIVIGALGSVGAGTIAGAVGVGTMVGVYSRLLGKWLDAFLADKTKA